MSWHSSAIILRAVELPGDPFLLARLGFPGATAIGPVDFDNATSIGVFDLLGDDLGAAVARVEGWASIWGPVLVADGDALAHFSRDGLAFTLMLEGATGTAGFDLYRGGSLARSWMVQEDEALQDDGPPLPEEADAPDDPEARVLSLLERLTLPLSKLDGASYTLYRFPG